MMFAYLGEVYKIYIQESGRISISRDSKTIEQTGQLDEILVDPEATEELDQVKDARKIGPPLVAPAEKLAPSDPEQSHPDLALEPHNQ